MKYAITIFLSSIYLVCCAQEIDSNILLGNAIYVDNLYKFCDGETPTFRLRDNAEVKDVKWTLNITLNESEESQVLESSQGSDRFSFTITPDLFPKYCIDCKKFEFEGDTSLYIQGVVKLYHGSEIIDDMPILFNVLPSRPVIQNASLNGYFDFQNKEYIPSAELSVSLVSARAEQCLISQVMSDSLYVTQFPEQNYWVTSPVDRFRTTGDIHEVEYLHADWGQYYVFTVSNKYGSALGDTLFSTDCISDEKIISAIKSLYEGTDNCGIENEKLHIWFSNDRLVIDGYTGDDITTSIYTEDGVTVFTSAKQKTCDLSFLPKGRYIIRIMNGKNKMFIKKIFKL